MALPGYHSPEDECRYQYRIRDGIGICLMCGATVPLIRPARLPGDAIASWHVAGEGVDSMIWDVEIHGKLPEACPGSNSLALVMPATEE